MAPLFRTGREAVGRIAYGEFAISDDPEAMEGTGVVSFFVRKFFERREFYSFRSE